MRPLPLALAAAIVSVAAVGYSSLTVEIPANNMLVSRGSGKRLVVATFPQTTRVSMRDARLINADMLPYWRWQFDVARDVEKFQYGVTMSIMGTPEEALKYHSLGYTGWRRTELQQWTGAMLHRFEADTWGTWSQFRKPPTESEEAAFTAMLKEWFHASRFANQGIHIDRVTVSLPHLAP